MKSYACLKEVYSMEKRVTYKYIFLLIVGLFAVVISVLTWLQDEEQQQTKGMFEETTEQQSEQLKEVNEKKMNPTSENKEEEKENEQGSKENDKTTFDEQIVAKAKEQAKTGLALYLLQERDWEKWKAIATNDFIDQAKQDIQPMESRVKRGMEKIELFPSHAPEEEKMVVGAFATWHVTMDGKTVNKSMHLYYITLIKREGIWLVDDIVSTNQKSMEDHT